MISRSTLLLLLVGWLLCLLPVAAQEGEVVLKENFESGVVGDPPSGWFSPPVGPPAAIAAHAGEPGQYARLELGDAEFANMIRSLELGSLQGQQVRFAARVRVQERGHAQLWLRFDYADESGHLADNMGDRPIQPGDWAEYEIIANAADKPGRVVIGVMGFQGAQVSVDDVVVEALGTLSEEPLEGPRKLTNRGEQNLLAFARLLGYVRYFHPSDEAQAVDWDRFAIEGARAVESARNSKALVAALQALFQPIAPTVQVFLSKQKPVPDGALKRPETDEKQYITAWLHHGVGISPGIYASSRNRKRVKDDALPDEVPNPADAPVYPLAGGVACCVPLALWSDRDGTFPKGSAAAAEAAVETKVTGNLQSAWNPNDRGVRLGAVIVGWNVFQHFYPYFDELEVDWDQQLSTALRRAALDEDGTAFLGTLERMVAALEDGHGYVSYQVPRRMGFLPFQATWASDELVVTSVHPRHTSSLAVGDRIQRIAGQSSAQYLEALEERISGATPQWKRHSSVSRMLQGPNGHMVPVVLKRNGRLIELELEYGAELADAAAPLLDAVVEAQPGIWYFDLDRAKTEDFTSRLAELEQAKGIVFDLRGYPRGIAAHELFAHLIETPVHSAWWKVPIVRHPDRVDWGWKDSRWTIEPKAPHLKAKLVFLTGGGAISYAESCMAIVEHYELAEIVGGPTAGTNGNINPFALPGGYRVNWTGMKVRKHDLSPHHGVGVLPTLPVESTAKGIAEGRDEVLEAGLRAAGGR